MTRHLLKEHFYFLYDQLVLAKLERFAEHADKIHLLTDFDDTLTDVRQGQKKHVTTFSIMNNHLPHEAILEEKMLYEKYRPIEIAHKMTERQAEKWWVETLKIYKKYRINIRDIERDLFLKATSRQGVRTLFFTCKAYGIPTVILSGGVTDVISLWCKVYNVHPTKIVSNKLDFDNEGFMTGWRQDQLIHSHNKKERAHDELQTIRTTHPYTVLIGDSLKDAAMADGEDTVLRIRIIDRHTEEFYDREQLISNTFPTFDLLIDSGSLAPLVHLITAFMKKK